MFDRIKETLTGAIQLEDDKWDEFHLLCMCAATGDIPADGPDEETLDALRRYQAWETYKSINNAFPNDSKEITEGIAKSMGLTTCELQRI